MRPLFTIGLALLLAPSVFGVPTFSPTRYVLTSRTILRIDDKINELRGIVQATRQQMAMLDKVNDAIQSVRSRSLGGIQSVIGQVPGLDGEGGIFEVGRAFGDLTGESMGLVRDVQSLPQEAQYKLEQLGLAPAELTEFLKTGMRYDTMQTLTLDDWGKGANPLAALQSTTYGRAVTKAGEASASPTVAKDYSDHVGKLTPEERAREGTAIGLDLAAIGKAGFDSQEKDRAQGLVVLQGLNNNLSKQLDTPTSMAGEMVTRNATEAAGSHHDTAVLNADLQGGRLERDALAAQVATRSEIDKLRAAERAAAAAAELPKE